MTDSSRQAVTDVAGTPTPTALIQRLLEIHGADGVDDLHRKVKVSTRTLQRWKSDGWPQGVREALELLTTSGLLVPAAEAADEQQSSDRALAGLAASVATLLESHREALKDLEDVRTRLVLAEEALSVPQPARARKPAGRKRAAK